VGTGAMSTKKRCIKCRWSRRRDQRLKTTRGFEGSDSSIRGVAMRSKLGRRARAADGRPGLTAIASSPSRPRGTPSSSACSSPRRRDRRCPTRSAPALLRPSASWATPRRRVSARSPACRRSRMRRRERRGARSHRRADVAEEREVVFCRCIPRWRRMALGERRRRLRDVVLVRIAAPAPFLLDDRGCGVAGNSLREGPISEVSRPPEQHRGVRAGPSIRTWSCSRRAMAS